MLRERCLKHDLVFLDTPAVGRWFEGNRIMFVSCKGCLYGTAARNWPVGYPLGEEWIWRSAGVIIYSGKLKCKDKNLSHCHFVHPAWTDLGTNLRHPTVGRRQPAAGTMARKTKSHLGTLCCTFCGTVVCEVEPFVQLNIYESTERFSWTASLRKSAGLFWTASPW